MADWAITFLIFCKDTVTHSHLNNNIGRKALQPNPPPFQFLFCVLQHRNRNQIYVTIVLMNDMCAYTPPLFFFLWKDDQEQLKKDYSHKTLWTLHCLRIMYRSFKQNHYLPKAMARKTTCRRYEKAQLKVQTGSHWKVVHRCKY